MRHLALAGLLLASPAGAGDLLFPVDCTLGQNCFIQNYVDRNPGPGVADFTCGPMTYDGHRGTDIRLIDRAAMLPGIDVFATAPGIVKGIRDGMEDQAQGTHDAPDLEGRDCGNGVLIVREDGWRFQYCHLRKESVRVVQGQTVEAGEVIGQIGLSGRTQTPHLHLTIRDQARRVIDPFDARQQDEACSLRDRRSLWRDLDADDYQAGGPLAAGLLDRIPDYDEVRAGTASAIELSTDASAIVFWAHFFGLRSGDHLELFLIAPDGEVLVEATHVMPRNRAQEFRAVGRKRRTAWPSGEYIGRADLRRGGSIVASISGSIQIQ